LHKPCFTLYLPAGTLYEVRPFKQWVVDQPTRRLLIAHPGNAEPCCDIVEFHTSIRWEYLRDTITRLLAGHCPYQFAVNLPDAHVAEDGMRFFRITERGVVGQSPDWAEILPVEREAWAAAFKSGGFRFSLFEHLAPYFLSPKELKAIRYAAP
jgi:hypothetical protein